MLNNVLFCVGVFPQSLSGSETDVSTSNENLSHEERYVIRHTARQEPQGQENLQSSNRNSLKESLPSNRSSLDVSSSSYNTLIIHSAGDEPWTGRYVTEYIQKLVTHNVLFVDYLEYVITRIHRHTFHLIQIL